MSRMHIATLTVPALFLIIILTGCAAGDIPAETTPPSALPAVSPTPTRGTVRTKPAPTRRQAFAHTPTTSPTSTQTKTSTPTFTTSPTPTLSETPTVTTLTPSPTAFNGAEPTLFPMSIEAMRLGSYPGSEITVDEELEAGAGYRRYYVFYLSQGLKIYALLTVPNGDPPDGGWPGIVFNHGYIPPDEYRSTERYIAYVDRLARSGYVVFRIDYRGHGNSEGDPQGAYGDPGYEVDVLNALASLKRFGQVNPDKIGMWGHSMGGYLTLRSMVISKDVKVGVIWAGVVAPYADILYKWPAGPSVPPANSRKWMVDWPAQFGTPEQNPAFWASISANSYLADLSGPLQLHYGTQDEDVPPEFSETLAEQVVAVGRNIEIYAYPGDNHNLSNYFNLAMDRTIEYFDRYLK